MGIIDLHCDTLLDCFLDKTSLRDAGGHVNLQKMKEGGGAAQCFAMFIGTEEVSQRWGRPVGPYELFSDMYDYYRQELSACEDMLRPALKAEDVAKNQEQGFLSSILTVEDCALLEDKIQRVDEMAEKGVRMAALIWNFENCLGYPHSGDGKEHERGLKPFGVEAVLRMNEKGIIVDVSHLSQGGFFDVVKHSRKPFAASHSCARALCGHSRNLSDEQLRALGETGGVAGVNFYALFLTEGGNHTTVKRIAEHAVYMADKAGVEAVAMGSDFDGIQCTLEMEDYTGFPLLTAELQRHFSDDDVERIMGGNFLRVMKDNE